MTATAAPLAQDPSLAARRAMIDSQLRPQGVNAPRLLAAFAAVAREAFVPAGQAAVAYQDRRVATGDGAALMPAAALGLLIQDLDVQPGDRVLLVSAAPGYAAALLEALGASVTTLSPAEAAGGAPDATFDRLLVDGAVEALPAALTAALADGARVATGLVAGGVTRLARGLAVGGTVGLAAFADADLPVLGAFDRPRGFTF